MGACRYSNIREVSGEALGYMTGNIVEEASGSLRLTYSSGDRCGSGRARTVHVEFRCEENAGAVSDEMNYIVTIIVHSVVMTVRICPVVKKKISRH